MPFRLAFEYTEGMVSLDVFVEDKLARVGQPNVCQQRYPLLLDLQHHRIMLVRYEPSFVASM
jgi:hypothetical protein